MKKDPGDISRWLRDNYHANPANIERAVRDLLQREGMAA